MYVESWKAKDCNYTVTLSLLRNKEFILILLIFQLHKALRLIRTHTMDAHTWSSHSTIGEMDMFRTTLDSRKNAPLNVFVWTTLKKWQT